MDYNFRAGNTENALAQSSYLPRAQINDYQAHQVAYNQSRFGQQDVAAQYSEVPSPSRLAQPQAVGRQANAAEHLQYQDIKYQDVASTEKYPYGQQATDYSLRMAQYRQPMTTSMQSPNVLPPLSSSTGSTAQPVVPSSTNYSNYGNIASAQSAGQLRGGYAGYPQAGTQIP